MDSWTNFLKCISSNSQKMVIPPAAIPNMPPVKKVMLRDRYGNLWTVKVDINEEDGEWSFKEGWPRFYKENHLKPRDFLAFQYQGGGLFNVKIFGLTACEKKGVLEDDDDNDNDDVEEEEEWEEVRRSKKVAPNFRTRQEEVDGDDDDDDEDDDDDVDGDDDDDEKKDDEVDGDGDDDDDDEDDENVQEEQVSSNDHPFFVSRSRGSRTNELLIPQHVLKHYKLKLPKRLFLVDVRGNKWETRVEKRNDGRQICVGGLKSLCRANNINIYDTCICDLILEGRQDPCIRVRVVDAAGTSRNASRQDKRPCYKKRVNDYYGADIFEQGRATRPKDCPFFVSRSRPRRHEIMIPNEVIVDYKLNLPEALPLVDENGKRWEAKVKHWKDRVVCGGGWSSLCKVNNIQENDACICEFYLQRPDPYILVRRI